MKLKETEQAITLEPSRPATAAVIWLHGLGADGSDFVPIVAGVGGCRRTTARFIFPNAPVRPTINNGMRMRAHDILSLTKMQRQDEAGIRDSERIVRGFIEDENARGSRQQDRPRRLFAGRRHHPARGAALPGTARRPAGLVDLSCRWANWPSARPARAQGHADQDVPRPACDQMLPMALGDARADALREWGYTVDWHEYSMQHQVCAEEIEEIGAWLIDRLQLTA